MKFICLPLLTIFFAVTGCAHEYPQSDALLKGDTPVVPAEFKNGSASLKQVKAWSVSLLSDPSKQSLEIIEKDLNQDGTNDLLVAEKGMAGTGGNSYLAFERTPRGYHYWGHLGFGAIRVLPKDESHQQKILTWWHLSAGEGGVTLVILDKDGFHEIANATVYAGDSGTEEGNRIADNLFGTNKVSQETLRQLFGKSF
jgi:hypothetical protein